MINEKRVALQKSGGDRPRNSAQYPNHIESDREREIYFSIHVELRNRSNNNPPLDSWHTKLNDHIFRNSASRFVVHESMNTKVGNEVMKKNQSLIIHDARFTGRIARQTKREKKMLQRCIVARFYIVAYISLI